MSQVNTQHVSAHTDFFYLFQTALKDKVLPFSLYHMLVVPPFLHFTLNMNHCYEATKWQQ